MSIWKHPLDLQTIHARCQNTLVSQLGIEFVECGEDYLVAKMPVDPRTCQPIGILHGGASAALAETVASAAAHFCVKKDQHCLGIELNINHIRAAHQGSVFAKAKPLHLGKTTQVWEIKIRNENGQLISAARLTVVVASRD